MKSFILIILIMGNFSYRAYAGEMSLLQEGFISPKKEELKPQKSDELVNPKKEKAIEKDGIFQEMDEFIRLENEKLKDIKLLNLDLEKVDLILKKKEIEQKISQLNVQPSLPFGKMQPQEVGSKLGGSAIRVVSVFVGSNFKQAILNANGVNSTVKEGEQIEGFIVKKIHAQKVVLQNIDGQIQELLFL